MSNGNGKLTSLPERFEPGFLDQMDSRTNIAKKLRASYEAIVNDRGGYDGLSCIELSFIERYIFLETIIRTWEVEISTSDKIKSSLISRWIQAVNSLQGLGRAIGLEKMKRGFTLQTYLADKEKE